jgi:alpha-L-fucosidase 2
METACREYDSAILRLAGAANLDIEISLPMRIATIVSTCMSAVLVSAGAQPARMARDIEYGQAGGTSLRLDACVPEGPGPFPVAILIHGGGWTTGDKGGSNHPGDSADISPWFAPLTAAKFTWFSINYRLAPANPWPACFEDVQTAIRWVKAHAAEYRGDPTRIALFGHSAGGQLACLAGTGDGADTRVQAVVGFAPVTDFELELPLRHGVWSSVQNLLGCPQGFTPEALALLPALSPVNHVRPGLPPFLIVQGDADRTVPVQESRNFVDRLRAAGVPCDLVLIPGAPHRLLSWTECDPTYPDRVTAWLRRTLGVTLPAP